MNGFSSSPRLTPSVLLLLTTILFSSTVLPAAATTGQCNTLVLFDDAVRSGTTLQANTNRASCSIVTDSTAPQGSKVLKFTTDSWLANSDGCALVFSNNHNLSLYTEIEFWLRSNAEGKVVTPAMESSNANVRGVSLSVVGTEWKRYRFPLPSTFDGLDFDHVLSAFIMQLQLNEGEEIRVDLVRLLCRNYFPIFTDETVPGRERLLPGGEECQILTDSDNHKYLRVDPNSWSCSMAFTDPRYNLNNFKRSFQFRIKSSEKTIIFIDTADGRHTVEVASSKGAWKLVTIAMSKFGNIDLSEVLIPFGIQRASSNVQHQEILIKDVHFLLSGPPTPPTSITPYCNNFDQATNVGQEWSHRTVSTTPAGNRVFLGPFDREDVTLTLNNLAAHKNITIEFDLFILYTWDGAESNYYGPDVWKLFVENGPVLLQTTFSNDNDAAPVNPAFYQNYPDNYPGPTHPGTTGAVERGTLGYPDQSAFVGYGDSVYRLSYTIPHTAGSIVYHFTSGDRFDDNEQWGIDNLCVTLTA